MQEQEGIIERMKAKITGASDLLNKPIVATELLTLAQKHTQSFANQDSLKSLNIT
ncbi:hypothetical protein NIES4102_02460 [Chondrocystis sp. NIES-4102]|nr:hypothetical protein NIES4102_02460 [Chondrocystis sp. NIES-4102]